MESADRERRGYWKKYSITNFAAVKAVDI